MWSGTECWGWMGAAGLLGEPRTEGDMPGAAGLLHGRTPGLPTHSLLPVHLHSQPAHTLLLARLHSQPAHSLLLARLHSQPAHSQPNHKFCSCREFSGNDPPLTWPTVVVTQDDSITWICPRRWPAHGAGLARCLAAKTNRCPAFPFRTVCIGRETAAGSKAGAIAIKYCCCLCPETISKANNAAGPVSSQARQTFCSYLQVTAPC